jgi:hypothetical protein
MRYSFADCCTPFYLLLVAVIGGFTALRWRFQFAGIGNRDIKDHAGVTPSLRGRRTHYTLQTATFRSNPPRARHTFTTQ